MSEIAGMKGFVATTVAAVSPATRPWRVFFGGLPNLRLRIRSAESNFCKPIFQLFNNSA
jgi:hypothetical protein